MYTGYVPLYIGYELVVVNEVVVVVLSSTMSDVVVVVVVEGSTNSDDVVVDVDSLKLSQSAHVWCVVFEG